jgi:hypothetical protein
MSDYSCFSRSRKLTSTKEKSFQYFPCVLTLSTSSLVVICLCRLTYYRSPLFDAFCALFSLFFMDFGIINFVLIAFF